MSSEFDREKLVGIFLTEATDGIQSLRLALYPSEDTLPDPASLHDLYIVAHRVKGSALQYGFTNIADAGASLEALLEQIEHQSAQEDWPAVVGQLRELVSRMEMELEAIEPSSSTEPDPERAEETDSQANELTTEGSLAKTEPASLSDQYLLPEIDEEIFSYFGPEAQEYLDTIETDLLRLEQDPGNPETIQELFRTAHTLKGSAYTIGFEVIGDVAHPVEDLLGEIRQGQLQVTTDSMDLIFRAVDVIRLLMARNPSQLAEVRHKVATLVEDLKQRGRLTTPASEEADEPMKKQGRESLQPALGAPQERETEVSASEPLPDKYIIPEMDLTVVSYFVPDAQESLNTLEAALFRLEKDGEDQEALQLLWDAAQTLKTSSHEVQFQVIGDLMAQLEKLILPIQEGRIQLDPRVIDPCFRAVDTARLLLQRDPQILNQTRTAFATVMRELGEELQAQAADITTVSRTVETHGSETHTRSASKLTQAPEPSPTDEASFIRVSQQRLERLLNLVGELVIGRGRLDQRLKLLEHFSGEVMSYRNRLLETIRSFEAKHEFNLPTNATPSSELSSTDYQALANFGSLELDKYDDFNILSRRIAEVAADVSESMTQLNESIRQAREDMGQLQHLTTGMRYEIARTRMVPIGRAFLRFQRAAREMARATNKEVTLVTSGEQTEVDTTLVERLVDPLVHLVRNAVYHGIELPAARIAADKPPVGSISISASHRGNQVIIEVEDDGAGLDLEKIKAQAIAKGHLRPEVIAQLSQSEIINLIFLSGFSTADSVGDQAGRGVGMDVVKRTIEGINGHIQVESEKGKGTKFTLELPLTLLISTALLVRVSTQRFAIPLPAVREVILPAPEELQTLSGRTVLQLEDETIDVGSLAGLLQLEPAPADVRSPVVITRTPSGPFGLIVDELLGRQEIVIKGLGTLKPIQRSYFGGATIDPQGRVILVLDVARLTGRANEDRLVEDVRQPEAVLLTEPAGEEPNFSDVGQTDTPTILLIDDSLSIRKFVGQMLEAGGYVVETAVDGEEGLRKSGATPYSVIITDLEMPKINGYEVIQAVRSRPQTRSTPVIVMTTRAGDKHRQLAMNMGASAYITKPVEERALIREVSRWIGSRAEVRK